MEKGHEVAWEILRYLEKHPEAKDTSEGIARWWLQQEGGKPALKDVERAVAFLLVQDLILETRRKGVPPYYQVNPRQSQAIAEILKGL